MLIGQISVALDQELVTLPSRVERIAIVPDQSAATIVVSRAPRWGICIATNRRCVWRGAAGVVDETDLAGQHRAAKIESLPVGQHRDRVDVEPGALVDPEGQRKPVRQVDKALVSISVPDTSSTRRLYTPAA